MVSEVFSFYKRQFSFYHIAANVRESLPFSLWVLGFCLFFFGGTGSGEILVIVVSNSSNLMNTFVIPLRVNDLLI